MASFVLSRIGIITLIVTAASICAEASKPEVGRLMGPKAAEAGACRERPAFMTEARSEVPGGLESLPKSLLVARDAEVWVEGAEDGTPLRLHAYQSFLKPKKDEGGKVLCGSAPEGFRERFSMKAPTLMDFTEEKKIGHSFWRFQVVAQDRRYSVWNQKSVEGTKNEDLESLLKGKTPYRLYQVGHNEYEMVMQKESAGVVQTLSIRYEVLR